MEYYGWSTPVLLTVLTGFNSVVPGINCTQMIHKFRDEPLHFAERDDIPDWQPGIVELRESGQKLAGPTESARRIGLIEQVVQAPLGTPTAALDPHDSQEEARTPTEAVPGFEKNHAEHVQANAVVLPDQKKPHEDSQDSHNDPEGAETPVK